MGRIEYKRIVKLNWQFDKMSRLEFVATQFGVKISVMYNLQLHVDKNCQRYLHDLFLFRKLCYFTKYSMILSFCLFVFKVILFYP